MRLMMQSLLADRSKLSIHIENQQVPVLALILSKPGKTGPQLQIHPASDTTCSTVPSAADTGDGMFPTTCGGIVGMKPVAAGNARAAARNVTMDLIASFLSGMGGGIDRPVLDQTGLSGKFDFNLEWAPEPNASSPTSGRTACSAGSASYRGFEGATRAQARANNRACRNNRCRSHREAFGELASGASCKTGFTVT
jgi:uncharacterized protein (TIGR03435 family)